MYDVESAMWNVRCGMITLFVRLVNIRLDASGLENIGYCRGQLFGASYADHL